MADALSPDELFFKWQPLAYKFTAGWRIIGFDKDDLIQEALLAIWRASRNHDQTKGCFYSLARVSIQNKMKDLVLFAAAKKRGDCYSRLPLDAPAVGMPTVDATTLYELCLRVDEFVADPKIIDIASIAEDVAIRKRARLSSFKGETLHRHAVRFTSEIDEVEKTFCISLKNIFPPKKKKLCSSLL